MSIEIKGWSWLYSVYGAKLVEDAVALYDSGWRPDDKDDLMQEYELDDDVADKYIDVFIQLDKDGAYKRSTNNPDLD